MAKNTKYIGLPITEDPNLRFAEWWRLINAPETLDNKPSAFQIIDKAIGEKVEVKENVVGEWKGTLVPNTGIVDSVYFNTGLSTEEVIMLCRKLSYYSLGFSSEMSFLLADAELTNVLMVQKLGKESFRIDYGNFNSFVTIFDSSNGGWLEFENPIIFGKAPISQGTVITTTVPIGSENERILSLISVTPFEQIVGQQGGIYFDNELGIAANVQASEEELEKMQNIKIGNQTFKMGDSEYTNHAPTTSAIGGIPKGTTFENKTIQEVLDMLLYPYVKFSCSFSTVPNGGVYEKGQEVTVTSGTVSITHGSVPIEKIEIYDDSTLIKSFNNNFETNTFTLSQTVYTNKSFLAKVTDIKGETSTVYSGAFKFVDPYYVGAIGENDLLSAELIKTLEKKVVAKGNKTYEISMNQQKAVIAYPSDYGSLTKIYDANNFDVTETFEKITLQINNTSYNVYVLSVPATSIMTYKFNY